MQRLSAFLVLLILQLAPLTAEPSTAPLRFTRNLGQIRDSDGKPRPDILFVAGAPGMRIYLRTTGISYVFQRWDSPPQRHPVPSLDLLDTPESPVSLLRVDVEFDNSTGAEDILPEGECAGTSNYYDQGSPHGVRGVRAYRQVTYREVYPNIDLVIGSSSASSLKYDLIVRPGGDPTRVAFRYVGAQGVEIRNGALELSTQLGRIQELAPISLLQPVSANDVAWTSLRSPVHQVDTVSSRYLLDGNTLRFHVEPYDRTRTLVIDPVLIWSTLLGGAESDYTTGDVWQSGIEWMPDGTLLVSGVTWSSDFPVTPGALQSTLIGYTDAVLLRMTRQGALIWSTYLGGGGTAYASESAVDSSGFIYLGGRAQAGMPVTPGAFQTTCAGNYDAYLARFDGSGGLVWLTYYGGAEGEGLTGLAVDARGGIIMLMGLASAGMATPGAYLTTGRTLVARFTNNGARDWATYTGSMGWGSVAADGMGNTYIVSSSPTGFPTTAGAFQRANAGSSDVTLASFTTTGAIRWATYVGGLYADVGLSVVVAHDSLVFFGGFTNSTNLPVTPNAYETTTSPPQGDAFAGCMSDDGEMRWLTYFGGTGADQIIAMTADEFGSVTANGLTFSTDLPVTSDAWSTSITGTRDIFLTRFDRNGRLLWSTYFGGGQPSSCIEVAGDLAVSGSALFVVGWTECTDFPTTPGALQRTLRGAADIFITRFCTITPRVEERTRVLCPGDSVVLSGPDGFDYVWSTGERTRSIVVRREGRYWFDASDEGCTGRSDTVEVRLLPAPNAAISPAGPVMLCVGQGIGLDAGEHRRYRWSTGDTTRIIYAQAGGTYNVTVYDTTACGSTASVEVVSAPLPVASITPSATALCAGDTLTLVAPTGALRYEWSSGANGREIRVTAGGTYSVRVTDSNGCTSDWASVALTMDSRPSVAISPSNPMVCSGDSLLLEGPPGFATYRWSNGAATRQVIVTDTGRVWLEVVDNNGCVARTPWLVIRYRSARELKIEPTSKTTICAGDSIRLTASEGFVRYVWSNGDTDRVTVASGPGLYRVDVVDSGGCRMHAEFEVRALPPPVPRLTTSGSASLCPGGRMRVRLTDSYRNVRWSDGSDNDEIEITAPGRYSATVIDSNGCRGTSDTLQVVVSQAPDVRIVGPTAACAGSTAKYAAPEASRVAYRWTVQGGTIASPDGVSDIQVVWGGTGSGRIDLHAYDSATGCTADTVVVVAIGSTLVPQIRVNGSLVLCPGDSVELDAGGGYTDHLWSTGSTARSIVVRIAGTYSVEVEGSMPGCRGRSEPLGVSVAQAVVPTIDVDGDELVSSPAAAYVWLLDGEPVPGAGAQRFRPSIDGSYCVRTIDSNGCSATSEPHTVGRSAGATIAIGTTEAHPGEEVDVPILLKESSNLDASGLRDFEMRIRFNSTLLMPRDPTPMGVLQGRDRVVTYRGTRESGMACGIIGRLQFIAALGDTSLTPIAIESFAWLGGQAANRIESGSISIVAEGGWRSFRGDGVLRLELHPNPSTREPVQILMEVIEPGRTRLTITDALGRQIQRLVERDVAPGVYRERFDLDHLVAGAYYLLLETPSGRLLRPIVLLR